MALFQTLPGFRDFYPADCAERNYLFAVWRRVAMGAGFVEYEAPVLEPTELYKRKSGEEIVKQLFHFTDGGERGVALRPETTPSLARMAAARQRDYKKPMKWFQIGSCFRYETPQKGRGREFYQFNCDILGEASPAADGELVATAVNVMRELGFGAGDFVVRLSDRNVWGLFLKQVGLAAEVLPGFLQIIDKMEREKPGVTEGKLAELGTSMEAVRGFMAVGAREYGPLVALMGDVEARGLAGFVELDLGIVRGLAYYTGIVFEIFDTGRSMRAVAGGGRYDSLCELIGGVPLAACGFAMGDMVLGNFIGEVPAAKALREAWVGELGRLDVYVVVASEVRRGGALQAVQELREAGLAVDYAMTPTKVGKQFQTAEAMNARVAVVIGEEYPSVQVKDLLRREGVMVEAGGLVEAVWTKLASG